MANYSHARIAFDQALGRTLEVNHISMDEAIAGTCSAAPSDSAAGGDSQCSGAFPSQSLRCRCRCLLARAPVLGSAARPSASSPFAPPRPILWRPYQPVTVPPVRLANSDRLKVLIRAGKLYLTAHDAIALALENNIDIEIARYNPTPAWRGIWNASEAGGALPGVPSGCFPIGVGRERPGRARQPAGGGRQHFPAARGGSGGTTNATVSQVGPVTPDARSLDSGIHHFQSPQQSPAGYRPERDLESGAGRAHLFRAPISRVF